MAADLRLSGAQLSPREESDIRYNYVNEAQIVAASTQLGGTQPMHYSTDGGATWQQSSLPPFTGDARQGDPTIDWTSDGTAWSITIGISPTTQLVLRSFKSIDAGATWAFDSNVSSTQTNMDREALWIDHSRSSPHRDNMYVTWHNSLPCFVSRRIGPNGTWQAQVQVSGGETTGTAIGGDIKTNANGDVFVFWPDTVSQNLFLAKSTDGGATFSAFSAPVPIAKSFGAGFIKIPAQAGRSCLIYLSGGAYRAGTKDLVYATWTDLAGGAGCNASGNQPGSNTASLCKTRIWFARSTDGGATWEPPRKLNDQSSLNDQFFQRLAVDETTGALVVVYYDTVKDPSRLKTDLWMQASVDDGATWSSAVQVTSAETDETSAGAESDFQYGDYIGLTGHAGQFFACWTDRRGGGFEEIWGAPLPKWADNNLTGFAHGVPAAAGSALDGYGQADGSQHVNFVDANENVHELYRSPDSAAQWIDSNLTNLSGGTPAAAGTGLDGYGQADGSQHVNFVDANGDVHELYSVL